MPRSIRRLYCVYRETKVSVYTSPDYYRFIDDIRARPDDDLPRLICADWLEEQGEADRARFIRVQCRIAELERESGGKLPGKLLSCHVSRYSPWKIEAVSSGQPPSNIGTGDIVDLQTTGPNHLKATCVIDKMEMHTALNRGAAGYTSYELRPLPPCPLRDEWRELKREEKELHGDNYSAHMKTLPLISHPTGYPNRIGIYSGDGFVEFVRGFVENIRIRGADWIEHAEAILKANPIHKVTLIMPNLFRNPTVAWNYVKQWTECVFEFEYENTHAENIYGVSPLQRVIREYDVMQAIDQYRRTHP